MAFVVMGSRSPTGLPPRPALALALVVAVPAIMLAAQAALVRRALSRLDARHPRGIESVRHAELVGMAVSWVAVAATGVATLGLGWLESIRAAVGNLPAVDELVGVAPAVVAMALSWWIGEPIERRVREASYVRRLDQGRAVVPSPSRVAFVVERCRSGVLLILVPIAIVIGLGEALAPLAERAVRDEWREWARQGALVASALVTYVASPLLARLILRLKPMPACELHDDLIDVCRTCGVRVSGILLWDTRHAVVNGAVMGLVAPLRYVMLTDALLETLPREQIRAVMAHEIGHVRRRHLPWMLGAMIVLVIAASLVVQWSVHAAFVARWGDGAQPETVLQAYDLTMALASLAAFGIAFVGFGWVSRRFERQADAFAVQYLTRSAGVARATPGAVAAMRDALLNVAESAGVDPHTSSWRHGSIMWRRRNLAALVDTPIDRFAIDRSVRRLKVATAAGLVLCAWLVWSEGSGGTGYDQGLALLSGARE